MGSTVLKQFARRYCIGARQTLAVRERIQNKREQAVLGGGQKRIDTQHKKVFYSNIQNMGKLKICFKILSCSYFYLLSHRVSFLQGNESRSFVTLEALWNMTCSWNTRALTLEWKKRRLLDFLFLQASVEEANETLFFSTPETL